MTSKKRKAFGVLHVSPNTDSVTNTEASDMARRATRLNPRLLYASQNAPAGAEGDPARVDAIQIEPARYNRVWGHTDPMYGVNKPSVDVAVAKTLTRIDKAFGQGAKRVIVDEVRGNTANVAAEVFRKLPPEYRNKVMAYIVGGPNVTYQGNKTFSDPHLWDAMRGAGAEAVLESYGSPNLDMKKGAAVIKDKVDWLARHGIVASPAVGLGDKYNRPQIDGDWGGVRERAAANNRAQLWAAAVRHAVGRDVPISEWVAGTAASPLPQGRMKAFLRGSR